MRQSRYEFGLELILTFGLIWGRLTPVAPFFLGAILIQKPMQSLFRKREWIWDVLAGMYLILFIFDLRYLSRHLGLAMLHFVLFLVTSRIWVPRTKRTEIQLLFLLFTLWVLMGALNNDMYFFVISLLSAPFFLCRLIEQNMDEPLPIRLAIRWGIPSFIFIFLVALAIFFIMPRYQLGVFAETQWYTSDAVSGFSSIVALNDVTQVADDPTPAFEVLWSEGLRPPPSRMYWRGLVFERFDGRFWYPKQRRKPLVARGYANLFTYKVPKFRPLQGTPIEYRIIPKKELPAFVFLGRPVRIVTRIPRLILSQAVALSQRVSSAYTVTAEVYPSPVYGVYRFEDVVLTRAEITEALTVPPIIQPLSSWVEQTFPERQPSLRLAQTVADYLRKNYTYTTMFRTPAGRNPILYFLLEGKAGFCEYFSTAMALILRIRGVPARLVTGYRGAKPIGEDAFLVQERMAHAWVEVFDKETGMWIGFDPTPSTQSTQFFRAFSYKLSILQNKLAQWWDENVVLFSARKQWDILSEIVQDGRSFLKKVSLTFSRKTVRVRVKWSFIAGGIAFVLMILAVMYFFRPRKKEAIPSFFLEYSGADSKVLRRFYQFIKDVQVIYGSKYDHETWTEYFSRITTRGFPQGKLHELLFLFYTLRFYVSAHMPLRPEFERDFLELLDGLESEVKELKRMQRSRNRK